MRRNVLSNQKGSASVIVILVMLMLVVFGVLAFVSAGSSLRLAQKNAAMTQEYYKLDAMAEQATAQASETLKSSERSDFKRLESTLGKITGVAAVHVTRSDNGQPLIEMRIQDSKTGADKSLNVILSPAASGSGVVIHEWKLVVKPFTYEQQIGL